MKRKGTIWIVTGLLLIAAALCLTAYNLWDDIRAAREVEAAVERLEIGEPGEALPAYLLDPNMPMPVKTIDGLDYVGELLLPTLELELPVLNEWSYPLLQISPCRYAGSAYLDNLVIAAHNYNKHFGQIKNLALGDAVQFKDMDGNVFTYQVDEITTLEPTAVEEMTSGEWDMTLFTCTLGGQSRVTVRCVKAPAQ